MANNGKFLNITNGKRTQEQAIAASAGAADANKIARLDATGKFDASMIPPQASNESRSIQASEAIAAGALINIHDSAGSPRVRNADASSNKPADGFAQAAIASGASGTINLEQGTITGLSGLTIGADYWLSATTAGAITNVSPSAPNATQEVGKALSATELRFSAGDFIVQV